MIKANLLETEELVKELKTFKKLAFPFATKMTLNRTAEQAKDYAHQLISKNMIERNKWTKGSVKSKGTYTLDVNKQASEMGSFEDYMGVQEEGGTKTPYGKHGVAIPTGYAAGQEGAKPRTKLPKAANKLKNIQMTHFKVKGRSGKQKLLRQVNLAVRVGAKYIFWDGGASMKKRGIYKIVGGKATVRGWPKGAKMKMVYSLSKKIVTIPANKWMEPAAIKASKDSDKFYREALLMQIKRHRIMK